MRNFENSRKAYRAKQKRKKIIWTACLISLFLMIIGGSFILAKVKTFHQTVTDIRQDVGNRSSEEQEEIIKNAKPINIMFLGVDNGAYGRDVTDGRSDTMLLLTINPTEKKSQLLSIPRDTYTEIVGRNEYDKLNHAYAYGQARMAIRSVEKLLDTKIDFYVEINMKGLIDFVDAVGGIEVTSPLTFTYEERTFIEGQTELLDGESALRFARMRYDDPEGDFGRQKRQRIVIQQLMKKLMTFESIANFEEVMQAIRKNVKTDVPVSKALALKNTYGPAFDNLNQVFIDEEGFTLTNQLGEEIYYSYAKDEELLEVVNLIKKLHGEPQVNSYSLLREREDMTKYIPTQP